MQELVGLSGPETVHGIIPTALIEFERKYTDDTESATKEVEAQMKVDEAKFGQTTVVPNMHTRKQTMVDEVLAGGPGSGFVAMSGGYGTLEELMEVCTQNTNGLCADADHRPDCYLEPIGHS